MEQRDFVIRDDTEYQALRRRLTRLQIKIQDDTIRKAELAEIEPLAESLREYEQRMGIK